MSPRNLAFVITFSLLGTVVQSMLLLTYPASAVLSLHYKYQGIVTLLLIRDVSTCFPLCEMAMRFVLALFPLFDRRFPPGAMQRSSQNCK